MRCASVLAGLAAAIVCAGAASTATTETFKSWSATTDEVNTGEDVRKTCSATTAVTDDSGQKWTATLTISNGDVLPPDSYPAFEIVAAKTGFPGGENLPASFDFGTSVVNAAVMGDGRQWMMNNSVQASQAVFRGMAKGDKLVFSVQGRVLVTLPLDGFTKAYRSLGDWCGYPTGDITG